MYLWCVVIAGRWYLIQQLWLLKINSELARLGNLGILMTKQLEWMAKTRIIVAFFIFFACLFTGYVSGKPRPHIIIIKLLESFEFL